MHLQLLGRFQVHRDGAEVPPVSFGGRKVRALLRVLAVRRPDLVRTRCSPRRCGPTVCPPTPPPTSRSSSTGPGARWATPRSIVTGSGGYALGALHGRRRRVPRRAGRRPGGRGRPRGRGPRLYRSARAVGRAAARGHLCGVGPGGAEPATAGPGRGWTSARRRPPSASATRGLPPPAQRRRWPPSRSTRPPSPSWHGRWPRPATPHEALARLAELRGRLADQLGVDPSPEIERLQRALLRGELRPLTGVAVPVPAPPRTFPELAFVGRDSELAAAAGRGRPRAASPSWPGRRGRESPGCSPS